MKLTNIDGHNGYVKNEADGTIININKKEIQDARFQKAQRKQKEKELEEMKDSVSELKNEINEIKGLLNKIVERL